MVKSISIFVLVALLLGVAAGAWVRWMGDPELIAAADVLKAVGDLWLNALRMTVVPLVFSLLVTGVASVTDAAKTGALVARAMVLFAVLLVLAAYLRYRGDHEHPAAWPVDRDGGRGFHRRRRRSDAPVVASPPTFAAWLRELAPANPVGAAADDDMLPLVVFALFFGFAATRLAPALRDPIVELLPRRLRSDDRHRALGAAGRARSACSRWRSALALQAGARRARRRWRNTSSSSPRVTASIDADRLAHRHHLGGQPVGRFTAATTPVLGHRGVDAILARLTAGDARSGAARSALPDARRRRVLPLAVAVFRFTSPVANLAVCFFVAHLYGIEPTLLQIVGAVVVAYAMSIGAVGLPGQVSFIASIAPICMALGVPIESLGHPDRRRGHPGHLPHARQRHRRSAGHVHARARPTRAVRRTEPAAGLAAESARTRRRSGLPPARCASLTKLFAGTVECRSRRIAASPCALMRSPIVRAAMRTSAGIKACATPAVTHSQKAADLMARARGAIVAPRFSRPPGRWRDCARRVADMPAWARPFGRMIGWPIGSGFRLDRPCAGGKRWRNRPRKRAAAAVINFFMRGCSLYAAHNALVRPVSCLDSLTPASLFVVGGNGFRRSSPARAA